MSPLPQAKGARALKILLLVGGGGFLLLALLVVALFLLLRKASNEAAREVARVVAEEARPKEVRPKAAPAPAPAPAPKPAVPVDPFRLAGTVEDPRLASIAAMVGGPEPGSFATWSGREWVAWRVNSDASELAAVPPRALTGYLLGGGWVATRMTLPNGRLAPTVTLHSLRQDEAPIVLDLGAPAAVTGGWVTRSRVGLAFAGSDARIFPREGGVGVPSRRPGLLGPFDPNTSRMAGGDLVLVQVRGNPQDPRGVRGYAELWDVRAAEPAKVQAYEPAALALSPSGKHLVVVDKEFRWRVIRSADGSAAFEGYQERFDRLYGILSAYSPAERYLALGWINSLYVVDLEASAMLGTQPLAAGVRPVFVSENRLGLIGQGRAQFYDLNAPPRGR